MMSVDVYSASSSLLAAPLSRPRPLLSETIYPAICQQCPEQIQAVLLGAPSRFPSCKIESVTTIIWW